MRKLLSIASCVMIALALVAAQEQPPSQSSQTTEPIQGPSFRTGIDLVAVDVSVVDQERTTGRRSPGAGLRREDRRNHAARGLRRSGQGRRRGGAKAAGGQDAGFLHEQPDAAERAADRVGDRSGAHRARDAPPSPRCGVALYRPPHVRSIRCRSSRFRSPACVWTSRTTKCAFAARCSGSSGTRQRIHDETLTASACPRRWQSWSARTDSSSPRSSSANAAPRGTSGTTSGVSGTSSGNQWRWCRRRATTAELSRRGLEQLLEQLAKVEGPKLMILLSEGFLADELEQRSLVTLAGEARTSINVHGRRSAAGGCDRQHSAAERGPGSATQRAEPGRARGDVAWKPVPHRGLG